MSSSEQRNDTAAAVSLAKILSYAQAVARNDPGTSKSDPPERAAVFAARDALFVGVKKAPGSKKRRRGDDLNLANRPCSPTLFAYTSAPTPAGSVSTAVSGSKRPLLSDKLETVISTSVVPLYDRSLSGGPASSSDVEEKLIPAHRYTSLGYLLLPIRRPSVLDKWTSHEIAVFESAICLHGKKFDIIRSLLPGKTTKEVIEFYYVWKNTSHKPMWKKTFKPVE